mmetsp:Transcript_17063/g.28815  ORF Transcript_17063/g.28815 Transcript_17063/m.28815 type:complete len:97 (-) Transcript_17063:166-456(-)
MIKAKRGILQSEVGFGSKPPKYQQKQVLSSTQIDSKHEKPQDYLGPGYYDVKGGFDNSGRSKSTSQKYLIGSKANNKKSQSFLCGAPRFAEEPSEK